MDNDDIDFPPEAPVPLTNIHRRQLRMLGLEHLVDGLGLDQQQQFQLVAESKLEIKVREMRQIWVDWFLANLTKSGESGDRSFADWIWENLYDMPEPVYGQMLRQFHSRSVSSDRK